MGFPVEMFTVLFAIPRTVGWLRPVARSFIPARGAGLDADPEQKIFGVGVQGQQRGEQGVLGAAGRPAKSRSSRASPRTAALQLAQA
jgi:hypothetical protein